MNRIIRAIVGAGLLALSGNAAAIMISDHVYGVSGYTAAEFDLAIQAFRDEVSTRAERKRLKKARKLDRKVERIASYLHRTETTGESRKLNRKNRKLSRKETRLLAILDGYLPEIDDILLDIGGLTNSSNPPVDDPPPPPLDEFLPLLEDILDPGNDDTPGTTPPGTPAVTSQDIDSFSVPEPSMPALLGLGLAALLTAGRRRTARPA